MVSAVSGPSLVFNSYEMIRGIYYMPRIRLNESVKPLAVGCPTELTIS